MRMKFNSPHRFHGMIKICLPKIVGLVLLSSTQISSGFSDPYGISGGSYRGPGFGSPGGSSLRCGRNLVNLGDYKAEVYDLCGEPESIETHTRLVGSKFRFPNRTIDIQEYQEIQVEEWIYKFGSKRFRQYLRFENGRLVEIKSLDRSP
ncbi:MAG: DUF2845 domain-containing protein [Gammaproteobacteria bacterium]